MRTAWRWLTAHVPRRALVWATVLAAAALGLGFVPLFNVLGYDFAFALGLVTAFAAVDIGQGIGAAARAGGPDAHAPSLVAARAVVTALATLVLPLLLSLAGALRVRNCNLPAGLAFYALLPVATAVFAATLGAMAGLVVQRRGRLLALLLPVGSIIWTAVRLYRDPPAFALDPFGGFFPGPIYDEALQPPERLVWFRAVNLVWAATAVALVIAAERFGAWRRQATPIARGSWLGPAAVATFLALATLGLYGARGALGFHIDKGQLRKVLRRESTSPHFVVLSDPSGDGSRDDRTLLLADLEFRYQQLKEVMGAEPTGPVTIYLFPSGEAKKNLVGAGGTLYAKPWKREIFLQFDRFPARNLRHELAHVFAGAFGDPVFGISIAWRLPLPRISSGLVEGIAEAADFGDPDGRATVHQEARAMILAGLAPPLARVVGAGFTTVAGPRAYTIAGSFTHFLLATRGAERLRAAYRSGGDFEGTYGVGLAALETEWRAYLEQQPVDQREKARARERFRRPAIFQKVCARDIAARIETARGQLYSLPEEARAIFASVCQDDPGEPGHRLNLADAEFVSGEPQKALATAQAMIDDGTLTDPLRARAANLAANIHYHAGRFAEAGAAVKKALELATEEGEQRSAFARTRALADEVSRATIGRILFGDSPVRGVDPALVVHLCDSFSRAFPDEALGPYLLGRQLLGRDPKLALGPIKRACPLDDAATLAKPLHDTFRTECHRMLGDAAFRARDLATSEQAFLRLQQHAAAAGLIGERLRATDWLERIAWERKSRGAIMHR